MTWGKLSLTTVVAVLAAFYSTIECPLEPEPWPDMPPLPELEGPYAANTLLAGATRLHEGEVLAPESFAIGDGGVLYGGLSDGRVVAMDARGENPKAVFFSGGFILRKNQTASVKGDGNGLSDAPELMAECHELAQQGRLHLSIEKERACGRPLGLRWRDGRLYIVDPYHGLFALDPAKGTATHLYDPEVTAPEAPQGGSAAATHPDVVKRPRFLNDLAFAPGGGAIYMTDSSWKNYRAQNRIEILDGGSRGRLLRLDLSTGRVTTVMCGLHFPNGVEVDPSRERLVLVESMRLRLLSFRLADIGAKVHPSLLQALQTCGRTHPSSSSTDAPGKKYSAAAAGERLPEAATVMLEGLPGFGDNIRWDAKTNAYLLGVGTKISRPFSALHMFLGASLPIRRFIGKLLPMPVLEKLVPRYGMLLAIAADGTPRRSYHDPSGALPFISEAARHPTTGFLFMGSHSNKFLARLMLP